MATHGDDFFFGAVVEGVGAVAGVEFVGGVGTSDGAGVVAETSAEFDGRGEEVLSDMAVIGQLR